jgi:long-chain acyl-CoA synthetase
MSGSDEPAWLRAEREFHDDVVGETVAELFEASAARHADSAAQQYKGGWATRSLVSADVVPAAPEGDFATLSYEDLRTLVRHLAAGFRALGLGPDDRVAIFANTRMEWAQVDFALLAAGCVVTTVYTESSPSQVRYLVDDPGASAVVVENERLLERVREVEDDLSLDHVVLVDEPVEGGGHADVLTLADVHELGTDRYDHETYRGWLAERVPEDLASLIYTSGTTGTPKGVRLTHRNFLANVCQVRRRLAPRPDKDPAVPTIDPATTALSFLPLAHVFERLAGHFLLFASGVTVAYAESPDTLAADLQLVEPNVVASVPRVYERVYDRMRGRASGSALRERIFEWAVDVAREFAADDDPGPVLRARHAVADRLVYSTVRDLLGGDVEFMVSGGGSLSPELTRLFLGMGITVVEGYGLTETAPVLSVNPLEDIRPGTLGHPVVGVETRIDESVVDAEALTAEHPGAVGSVGPVGELLVRGENVTEGYWDRPRATDAAFVDGWFRTGDIVEETPDGFLIFRERRRELLVLSTGKNVAPGPIESRFRTDDRVAQAMVVGDGRRFVGALIVPNFERLRRWADSEGIDLPADRETLCEDDRVREWVAESVRQVNAEVGRVGQIKRFALVPDEWTPENDMLTPSMKKKRRHIAAEYDHRIEALYAEEGTPTAE